MHAGAPVLDRLRDQAVADQQHAFGRLVDAGTGKPVTRARILVDGVASRRYGVDPSGRFTRIASEGEHQVNVAAIGYAPRTLSVKARAGWQSF